MADFVASTQNLELPAYDEQMRWGYYLINAALGAQTISLKYQNERGAGIVPQGIIVDTTNYSGGTVNILWDVGDINFPISVGAGVQVSMVVPAKKDATFTVTPASGSSGTIRLDLTNFPLLPVNLTSLSSGPGDAVTVTNSSSQPVPVTDQTLSGLISSIGTQTTSGVSTNTEIITSGAPVSSGNALPVSLSSGSSTAVTNTSGTAAYVQTASGTSLSALLTSGTADIGNVGVTPSAATLVSGTATASGSTTIGTPPSGSNLRKMALTVTENATQATAGENTITVSLNGVPVYTDQIYIPATALAAAGALYMQMLDFDTIAFRVGSAGTLAVNLGTALTAGALVVNAYFD